MSEIKRSVTYAVKRAQAQRNCETHIQKIVFAAAKDIVRTAQRYRRGKTLTNETALMREARAITAAAEDKIDAYITAYAKAACTTLQIGTESIDSMLVADIYGKTMAERTAAYLTDFAEDIVRMIKAGTMMAYSDSQILSAIRTGYKDPYRTSVITKAQRKDINIATPSYGKGIYQNAYQNIVRNAKQVIAIAWGLAEQEYGRKNGAIGFNVFRGSSYPCHVCDDQCAYTHSLQDPYPPFHVSCVCRIQFIYKK